MGAFGTGFLGSIGDAVHQKAALARANEQKQKDAEAQYHWEALKARLAQGGSVNPTTGQFEAFTPEQRDQLVQDATGNMAKAYGGSKPVKELMQHAQQLIGKATNHPLWGHPGSENMQKDATPAAAATPAAPQASATGIPAPPGLQAQATAPTLDSSSASDAAPTNMLGSASASDAAPAVSSPTSALASASQGLSDGKSASGPSDNQQVAPQTSSVTPDITPDVPRGTTLPPPPSSKAATAAAAPQGLPPAAAGVASWNPTAHQLMNSFISPYDAARLQGESQNAIDLKNKQAQFEQQQAQFKQHLANLQTATGVPLTPTQTLLAAGVKIPAGMVTPHYNSKVVLAENTPTNAVMVDGSKPSDHPGQVLQQVQQGMDGVPIYNTVNVPTKTAKIGNQLHVLNGVTGEDLGVTSQTPINLGTSNTTLAPISGVVDGQTVQLPGHRTSTPITGNAPVIGSQGSPASTQPSTAPLAPPPGRTPSKTSDPRAVAGTTGVPADGAPAGTPSSVTAPGGRVMQRGFVQMGQATAQGKAYSAVMDPYRQIFGDPDVPGIPPISRYASLADNPEASSRIGTAVKLAMTGLDEVSDKGGGLLQMFRNLGGLPSLETSANVDAINKAVKELTPLESEAYDRQMQMIGTLVGLRAITSASAAQGSVRTIMNEAPMFGINVSNSKEFNRRLAGFAQQMYTASAKSPVFSTADRNMFKAEAQHMAQLGYGALNPPPKGSNNKAGGPSVQAAPQHKIQVGNKFYLYKGNGDTGDLSNYSEVPK